MFILKYTRLGWNLKLILNLNLNLNLNSKGVDFRYAQCCVSSRWGIEGFGSFERHFLVLYLHFPAFAGILGQVIYFFVVLRCCISQGGKTGIFEILTWHYHGIIMALSMEYLGGIFS